MLDLCGLRNLICDINDTEKHMKTELGLTINEAAILCAINEGFKSNSNLAKNMNLSVSRISRLISATENKGFIFRKVEKDDKRGITFNLTKKGINTLFKLKHCESCLPKYIEKAIKERN